MMYQDPTVKALVEARERPAVIKLSFLSFKTKNPDKNIITVEGDDDKIVYSNWISRCHPEIEYEFFTCGGKRAIRQLKNLLLEDKGNAGENVYFIVDRDYDDLKGFNCTNNVFMLEGYSFENYLVTAEAIDHIVKVGFPLRMTTETREMLCHKFQDDFIRFMDIASIWNRNIFISRCSSIDIDKIIPSGLTKIATVKIGEITVGSHNAEDVIPRPPSLSQADVDLLVSEFETLEPSTRHRGKFIFKFFRAWLDCLAAACRNRDVHIFAHTEFLEGSVRVDTYSLSALAVRSPLPNGFSEFITSVRQNTNIKISA